METIHDRSVFDETIQSEQPVIIKFTGSGCPDCKRMDMFIGEIVEEYNNYNWYEVSRDELTDVAQQYEVMGIPSILVFQNGEKTAHLHSAYAKTPEEVQDFLGKTVTK